MPKPKTDETLLKLFAEAFSKDYLQYTNNGQKSQDEVASDLHIGRSSVSQWLNAKQYPTPDNRKRICSLFGIPADSYEPRVLFDLYLKKYEDPKGIESILADEIIPYCNLLSLDLDFLRAIQKLVDFDSIFPYWSPIVSDREKFYIRSNPFDTSREVKSNDNIFLQVVIAEDAQNPDSVKKRVFLQRADLVFLKEVQDAVKYGIESLFAKKRNDREAEVQAARRAAIKIQTDKEIERHYLSEAEMRLIDNGLNAPTLRQLQELPEKEEWLDHIAAEKPETFDSGEEFKAAWQRRVTKSKGRSK